MIPLFKVCTGNTAINSVRETINSGSITQGNKVDEFEGELAKIFCRNEVVSTNSCTSAIQLAFEIIKRKDPDVPRKFLASPLTCAAGIFPGLAAGFSPVWCDIENFSIDLNKAKEILNSDIQILTFVHWGGYPINFYQLEELKEWYSSKFGKELYVIEDCAHCFNDVFDQEKSSTLIRDNFKCYSFQAIKHVTTGDGGALLLRKEWYGLAKRLRWFGIDREEGSSFRGGQDIQEWGYKYHMNDIAASIGLSSLHNVNERIIDASVNAFFYDRELGVGSPGPSRTASPWLYSFLLSSNDSRTKFIEYLKDRGIQSSPVHSRVDTNSCMSDYKSLPDSSMLNRVNQTMVSIPVGWWISQSIREYIIRTCKEVLDSV